MSQTTEIVAHVVSGVVHSLRVSLYREWGVPYPWLRKSPMVRFKTDRAWPQPSPISDKMPPAVLHVPAEEKQEFLAQIVSRFQRQVTYSWLAAITKVGTRIWPRPESLWNSPNSSAPKRCPSRFAPICCAISARAPRPKGATFS